MAVPPAALAVSGGRGGYLSLRYALRWRLAQLCALLVRRAPAVWRGAVPALGFVGFLAAPGARAAVLDNLQHLLPDAADAERRRIRRQIFRTVARHYVSFLALPVTPPQVLMKNGTVEGYEHFLSARAKGRGVLVVGIHQGPAEGLLQAFPTRGVTYTAMVERLEPVQLDRLFHTLRTTWGHRYVYPDLAGTKAMVRALRTGGVAAMLIDRDVVRSGVPITLLGGEFSAPPGPLELARLTGAAIAPAYVHWRRDGSFAATFLPEFVPSARRGDAAGLGRDLERLLSLFLPHLRAYPGQWLVTEPLWRRRTRQRGSYTGARNAHSRRSL